MDPLWEGGPKICIHGPGQMTKMATMPIYGKHLKKASSSEQEVLGLQVLHFASLGVRVSVTFHLTCVHIIFSSVWVAEWPPFGK